jgi:hypothetical protein
MFVKWLQTLSCQNLDQGIIHSRPSQITPRGPICCGLTVDIFRLRFCRYSLLRLMAICTGTLANHTTVLWSLSTPSQSQSIRLAPFFSSSLSTYNMYCHLCQKRTVEDSFPFYNHFELDTNTPSTDKPFNNGACLQIFSICDGHFRQAVTGDPGCLFVAYSCQGGARGSIVVKALCYKPEGRGFDSRWGEFLNLPNPSGHTRPWGLLSL